ncbi:MAG: magnesium transporter CorA family protein [Gemmiger sp.]|uniref:magnesium transporter CorA family protein n=1 Tax=Gemmiger sp. TaxID=2049027 RepID=UPI002E7A4CC0|nr:magnesium transporter CorA family protein [Gemmiger sp.]MEE0801211.1 magnesium transporter CorA family protein [Gemmiger sp.]
MLAIYATTNGHLTRASEITEGTWISLTAPELSEVRQVAATLDIEPADLQAALDPEESARISLEDGYTVIIVDIPIKSAGAGEGVYTTIPLGILLTQTTITTVCSVETPVLTDFVAGRVRDFSTKKKMRFVYQILYRAASMYQQELRLIDRRRQEIEKNLAGTLRDSDLMELHSLESTLVYFATSLRANHTVLDRLTRYKRLEQYPDDMELLDDVIVEMRQAIEMTSIYRDDIKGTRELFSSILDNRLNNAMKYLTSITLLMAVPTVISGLYGMNVSATGVPFAASVHGFGIVCTLTLAICAAAAWILHKKHML